MNEEQMSTILPLLSEFFKCLRHLMVKEADNVVTEIRDKIVEMGFTFNDFKSSVEKIAGERIPEGDALFTNLKVKFDEL